MNMLGDIRVKTDKKYRTLYSEFKNLVIGDMHELFFISACVGYKNNKKKILTKGGDPRFWSGTITPEEYSCYYAMMLKDNNMDFTAITDDKVVISEIEKYANAGIEMLINDVLSDYLVFANDEYKVDISSANTLPRIFLQHLYDLI